MDKRQKYQLSTLLLLLLALLLAVPCAFKQDVKSALDISAPSNIQQDRLALSILCQQYQVKSDSAYNCKIDSRKTFHTLSEIGLENMLSQLFCGKTERIAGKHIADTTLAIVVPIFIRFRELII